MLSNPSQGAEREWVNPEFVANVGSAQPIDAEGGSTAAEHRKGCDNGVSYLKIPLNAL